MGWPSFRINRVVSNLWIGNFCGDVLINYGAVQIPDTLAENLGFYLFDKKQKYKFFTRDRRRKGIRRFPNLIAVKVLD